ncbi:family 78 glycoside hydrolase catalytic domain [Echinicola sp. 20G]|uniref:family 78 glycoside hydrolase catalytic domain n=1 Tax=Echinicola sp. 20G TaxID=2781961 RepID=UPI0019101368|nr:family 78 glycoside hydrolase catalytic domain [Echinicola sp. 20G]
MKSIKMLILFFLCSISWLLTAQTLEFSDLTCNSQTNPICIDTAPSFTWVMNAPGYGREQTAYEILVASNKELLNDDHGDLWSSGKILSNKSVGITYDGGNLEPKQKYYWKVRIWDENGEVTGWSPTQYFQMGLVDSSNWGSSKWIGLSKDTRESPHRFRDYKTGAMKDPVKVTSHAAGYFRKEFQSKKAIKEARAYICGLGYYELLINGEKVGDHVLDPAPSNYDKQAYYVAYDITEALRRGNNAVGIILGNGFYGQNISWKNDPESERDLSFGTPTVRLLMEITYLDGSIATVSSDQSWKESTGPIVFDNIYGGDTYDARYELGDWSQVGYDDSIWLQAKEVSPKVTNISAQQIPPIKKLRTFDPKRIFKGEKGDWIVDFGQNIAGWIKLSVAEKEGTVIESIATESLTQDGTAIFPGSTGGGANGMKQLYRYICKGEGKESWEPKFSYHGFRYVQISGLSGKPDAETIQGVMVATDIENKGYFNSSDLLLNKMHEVSKWTIEGNIHGIPEDCPHREKCGWLGDAHAFCEYALYNYELNNFYKKYMEDIRTQMRPVPGENQPEKTFQVPTMIAPGKRTSSIAKLDWGVATMYLPWYNYVYYGDTAMVREYYEEMKVLTNYYLTFKDDKGVVQNGMGDWCPPRWDRRLNPGAMECHPVISANAYFYDVLGIMERFAKINMDMVYQAQLANEQQELKDAFNAQFLEGISGTEYKWYGSQTATVMALQFGMVPEKEIALVVNGLVYDIEIRKGGHHSTGIHGNRYIYTVLSRYGHADLAHKILTTPTFPSQAYILNYGFTTWPERQFEWDKMSGLTNSLNHPMHSGFAAYFFESLGGIKSSYKAVGYKEFVVEPVFPEEITFTKVSIPTRYGEIRNNWKVEGVNFSMSLTVPFNTKAKVILSEEEFSTLTVNGEKGDDFLNRHKGAVKSNSELVLGSGSYQLSYCKAN